MNTFANTRLDELIVGQGLAGSLLAWRLIETGRRVVVIDDADRESASRVAAGLLNPLAGRRLRPPAQLGPALDASLTLWRHLEIVFGQAFFHPTPMLRIFRDHAQRRLFKARRREPAYRAFLAGGADASDTILMPDGGFIQTQTGWLDTNALLDALRCWLLERHALIETRCDSGEFQPEANHVRWRDRHADRVIFCEGWHLRHNHWFDWLPLQAAKGDILDLETRETLPEYIINNGCWAIPSGGGRLRFGASNQWHFDDSLPDTDGRLWLEQRLARLFRHPERFHTLRQRAGIRPGTADRQPFIGHHPKFPQLLIFNGFGARGTLFIPLHADALTRHLCRDEPLPESANIRRHQRRYTDAPG